MSAVVEAVRAELSELATPERAVHEKAYLKSSLVHLGARVPDVRRVAVRRSRADVPRQHGATLELVEALWATAVHELRLAAVEVLADRADLLTSADLPALEGLLREARTWALVDVLAPGAVGSLLVADPAVEGTLLTWAADADFWLRRAGLLAYLRPLRQGQRVGERPAFESFVAVADPLLEDREFFVRKAIGWVLREHGKRAPAEVFAWLLPRRQRAANLTLREAGKYLGEARRRALLEEA